MKKNKYIFIVLIVILANIFILIKNYNLNKKLQYIKNENLQTIEQSTSLYNLKKLSSSKYIKNLISINLDESLCLKYSINDPSDVKNILEDAQNAVDDEPSNISLNDDSLLILEFE